MRAERERAKRSAHQCELCELGGRNRHAADLWRVARARLVERLQPIACRGRALADEDNVGRLQAGEDAALRDKLGVVRERAAFARLEQLRAHGAEVAGEDRAAHDNVLIRGMHRSNVLEHIAERAAVVHMLADAGRRGHEDEHEVREGHASLQTACRMQARRLFEHLLHVGLRGAQSSLVDGIDVGRVHVTPEDLEAGGLKGEGLAQAEPPEAHHRDLARRLHFLKKKTSKFTPKVPKRCVKIACGLLEEHHPSKSEGPQQQHLPGRPPAF